MRRQHDDKLRAWAHDIQTRITWDRKRQVNLVFHGPPDTETSASAHADDEDDAHLMEFEDVTTEDLERLRELLLTTGVAHVLVKEHSPVLGTAIVADGRTGYDEAN